MSAEQQGGNQVWKLSRANKLVSCPQWEKCSHAAYRAKRENGYFWATALCREGWRAASSEGNLAEPAAASEQRKLLSSWALLCPLGHNYLHSSFPNVCFDVTDKCTTWYLLVFCLGARYYYPVFSMLKCNRDTTCLLKLLYSPSAQKRKKARFSFCSLTGGWAKPHPSRVALQQLLSTSASQQHVLKWFAKSGPSNGAKGISGKRSQGQQSDRVQIFYVNYRKVFYLLVHSFKSYI